MLVICVTHLAAFDRIIFADDEVELGRLLYSDPNLSQMAFLQMGEYMTANWQMYFVQVLPVLIGAQVGSFISSAGLD